MRTDDYLWKYASGCQGGCLFKKGNRTMDQGRILLKLLLDEVDLGDLKLDGFSDRLCIQKKVYLSQIIGLDLGYRYNWYLRGPYCPSLTESVFLLEEEINNKECDEEYCLAETAKTLISKAKELWALPKDISADDEPKWVELLASVHYLKTIAYWPKKDVTKEDVVQKLIETKPRFTGQKDLIEKAWERLSRFSLLDKKSLS